MKTRAAVAWKAGEPLTIEAVDLAGPKLGEVLVAAFVDEVGADELHGAHRGLYQRGLVDEQAHAGELQGALDGVERFVVVVAEAGEGASGQGAQGLEGAGEQGGVAL